MKLPKLVLDAPGKSRLLLMLTLIALVVLSFVTTQGESPMIIALAALATGMAAVAGQLWMHVLLRRADTLRTLTEQRLANSETRFERVVRGAADGLWDTDLVSGQTFVSARFKALLGYADDEMPDYLDDRLAAELFHPEDLPAAQALRHPSQTAASGRTTTLRMRSRSGQYRWFRLHGELACGPHGTPAHLTGSLTDVTDLRTMQTQLEWRALHDPLTGLPNRQLFLKRLNDILSGKRRHNDRVFAVLAMDFDRFKLVNDMHGHETGDQLLRSIALRLNANLREQDLVARFGGDEFLLLVGDAETAEQVQQIAARLVEALSRPHQLGNGIELTCTASIGVMILDPHDDRSTDLILREADAAMYQAKTEARGSYQFFDRELRMRLSEQAQLEADLRRADYDRDFILQYQPLVDLESGRISGFEALLRWRRNGDELVSPLDFIPMAEDTGLIVPIGRWVFARACRDLVCWRKTTLAARDISLSVNVSRRELIEAEHIKELLGILAEHGLTTRDINLEITETALVDDDFDLLPFALALRDAGFQLSMDDFGTGQSSLNSLHALPIHTVKIDKQFIQTMGEDRSFTAVVHAVVTLGRHMGLEVVAEGIESPNEVAALQAMECGYGQGYYFARPVDAGAAVDLLRTGLRLNAGSERLAAVQALRP